MTESSTTYLPTASPDRTTAQRRQRETVLHFYWITEGRIAAEMGVDIRHLCGHWGEPPSVAYASNPNTVTVFGDPESLEVEVVEETRDCRNCVRVLAAASRRKLAQGA
jgi:hypothetical protein